MISYDFKSCGVAPNRLFSVGCCDVCDLPLVHSETDGPPTKQLFCSQHDPKYTIPVRKKARVKTEGHMLLERVCKRNKDTKGAGSIKMTDSAREDLINEIDLMLKETK